MHSNRHQIDQILDDIASHNSTFSTKDFTSLQRIHNGSAIVWLSKRVFNIYFLLILWRTSNGCQSHNDVGQKRKPQVGTWFLSSLVHLDEDAHRNFKELPSVRECGFYGYLFQQCCDQLRCAKISKGSSS